MGTYLVGGVAVRIKIFGKSTYDIIKNKDQVLNSLNKVINTSIYNIEEYNDVLELTIKKEAFENNIHDLIKEISPIMNTRIYFFSNLYRKEIDIQNFNKENYPIELNTCSNENKFYINNGKIKERSCYPDYSYMLLRDDENNLMHYVSVYMSFINIWLDPSDIVEYPLGTINVLNKLTTNYFKNILAKSMFFYVD